jgi:CTP:phosphocholine cytidylyltransferase-like protein
VSRWTAQDGQRLRGHLEIEFEEKKNRQIYWDDVALFCYPQAYRLTVFPMKKGDVVEIDSLQELAALDRAYEQYV